MFGEEIARIRKMGIQGVSYNNLPTLISLPTTIDSPHVRARARTLTILVGPVPAIPVPQCHCVGFGDVEGALPRHKLRVAHCRRSLVSVYCSVPC